MTTVTVADILDAIDKNGVAHIHGEWSTLNGEGKITAGCALTQGAINLGVNPHDLDDVLMNVRVEITDTALGISANEYGLGGLIIALNDNHKTPVPAKRYEADQTTWSAEYRAWHENQNDYRSLSDITGYIRRNYEAILGQEVELPPPNALFTVENIAHT